MNNLTIPAYSEQAAQAVKERLDSLAKVPGSLGKLEELAIRLAGITGRTCPSFPQKSVVLFAADHDITLKGVSATGQEVTGNSGPQLPQGRRYDQRLLPQCWG